MVSNRDDDSIRLDRDPVIQAENDERRKSSSYDGASMGVKKEGRERRKEKEKCDEVSWKKYEEWEICKLHIEGERERVTVG